MPFYLNNKKKQRKGFFLRLKIYGFFILFLALVSGSAYVIFYSSLFQIKNIDTDFSESKSASALINDLRIFFTNKSTLNFFLGHNNILAWKSGEVDTGFLVEYPQIENIEIKKDYFERTISLTVEGRKRFGVWCQQVRNNAENSAENNTELNGNNLFESSCWWFNESGIIFADAPDIDGGLIRKVDDFSGRRLKKGNVILENHLAENLIRIFGVLENTGLPSYLKLDKPELQEIIAVPVQKNFPEIYFSLRIDPSFGLLALQKLKEINLANIAYIDLRVENRAYYKMK